MNDLLMSIDIGTTNCKAAVFDVEGRQLAIARREHTTDQRQPGPDDWWTATLHTMGKALEVPEVDPQSVEGLGFSGRAGSLLTFLDENDRVLRPQVDAEEVAVIAERLRRELFPDHLYDLLGNIGIVPWVLWMQENDRETLDRISKIMGGKDYVVYKLTGQFVSDLLDKYNRRKPVPFCEAKGIIQPIQHKLPPLVPATEVVGTVLPQLAAKFGLKRDLPVVVGGRDGTCAVTGVGVTKKGQACSTIASSVCIRVISDKILLDVPANRVECRMHTVPGLWILDSTPGGGTTSYRWFRNEFGHIEVEAARFTDGDAYALLNAEAAHTEPGADGLIFLPYFSGMSAPFRNRHARGVLFGLKLSHSRGHVIRAIKEGIIYANRSGLEVLEGLGAKTREIRATGGGTRSPLWNQIQADIMGVPVITSSVEEPECLGAAVILAVGLGIYKTVPEAIRSMVRVKKRYEPRTELRDVYDQNFAIYKDLCYSLAESWQKQGS